MFLDLFCHLLSGVLLETQKTGESLSSSGAGSSTKVGPNIHQMQTKTHSLMWERQVTLSEPLQFMTPEVLTLNQWMDKAGPFLACLSGPIFFQTNAECSKRHKRHPQCLEKHPRSSTLCSFFWKPGAIWVPGFRDVLQKSLEPGIKNLRIRISSKTWSCENA